MAQEVLGIVKVRYFSSVYTFDFLFSSANLPVRLYSMLRELHQTQSSSIPLRGSKTVWERMVLLYFQV